MGTVLGACCPGGETSVGRDATSPPKPIPKRRGAEVLAKAGGGSDCCSAGGSCSSKSGGSPKPKVQSDDIPPTMELTTKPLKELDSPSEPAAVDPPKAKGGCCGGKKDSRAGSPVKKG